MVAPWMNPLDLAPGDLRCTTGDWMRFELHRVAGESDPYFGAAFGALWNEFGGKGEMETRAVIASRLARRAPADGTDCALLYELMLVVRDGELVGVRDHTAIVRRGIPGSVVHLSHNLVAAPWRRSGIAGWLRALPVACARSCLATQRRPTDSPITLVGEMEPADPDDPQKMIRLIAYEKAGSKKIDPAAVPYLQPDFRPPDEIDATGGPRPVPLDLIVRRVGREADSSMPASETRQIVESLYAMYGSTFRERDMAPLWKHVSNLPAGDQPVALLPPTETVNR